MGRELEELEEVPPGNVLGRYTLCHIEMTWHVAGNSMVKFLKEITDLFSSLAFFSGVFNLVYLSM